ncbi:MAG: hypothetical protein HQ564_08675 [Candidatus Saganbacteria bacterium]|nr:hypothetical protein [Candidatus Saganbacteria bacterium]
MTIKHKIVSFELSAIFDSLDVVQSTSLSMEHMLRNFPELQETYHSLTAQLGDEGLGHLRHLFGQNQIGLSPSIEQGRITSEIEDYRLEERPNIHVAQLEENHRSLAIVLDQATIGLKGAGFSTVNAFHGRRSVLSTKSRSFAEANNLFSPFYMNDSTYWSYDDLESIYRDIKFCKYYGVVRNSTGFVGGFLFPYAEQEIVRSMAMHTLMMKVDGKRSNAHIPLRLDLVDTVVVRKGEKEITLAIEDYFTNPSYSDRGELMMLAAEAYNRGSKREIRQLKKYISILVAEGYKETLLASPRLCQKIGAIIKKYVKPVVLQKSIKAGLRVDHAWSAIFRPKWRDARNSDRRESIPTTKSDIDKVLAYIYHYYGEKLVLPTDLSDDHKFIYRKKEKYTADEFSSELHQQTLDVFAYLKEVSVLNRAAAVRIYQSFIRSFYREVGALHGAGGHFGGDSYRMNADLEYTSGAQGGDVITPRDVDILAGLHDFASHTYMPFLGIDTVRRKRNQFDKGQNQLDEHRDYLSDFQQADLGMAAYTTLLVDELLFGDPMRGTSDNTWDYWADAKTMLVIGDSGWNDSEIEAVYKKYYKKAQKVTF